MFWYNIKYMNTNPNAKRILCYGDSNTRGMIPITGGFYPVSISWPGQLQNILGSNFEIISEGLYGRTIVAEEIGKSWKTGITHLEAILKSHIPLDVLIIMLGTNDIKDRHNLSANQIGEHLEQLIIKAKEVLKNYKTSIIIICPPSVITPDNGLPLERMSAGPEKFIFLPKLYKDVAEKNNCLYINAGESIKLNDTDGYHLNENGHKKLAEVVAGVIQG